MVTHEIYLEAKEIVDAYEKDVADRYKIRTEAFRHDLSLYFQTNPYYRILSFNLNERNIIPTNPHLEEMYNGEMNKDIADLCEKHNVKFAMVYWCYHK